MHCCFENNLVNCRLIPIRIQWNVSCFAGFSVGEKLHILGDFMDNKDQLAQLIAKGIDSSLSHSSRIHLIKGYFPLYSNTPLYIKREDELSAGVVGSKLRKYLSLLPSLAAQDIVEVILIGSSHSNNVMGLAQLLIERGVGVTAFVKRPGNRELTGNHLFLTMLLPSSRIHYITSAQWPEVEQLATAHAQVLEQSGRQTKVIPEGGDARDALPGILTIATDIARNERETGIRFDHIWTDSGTGISAIGLLLGLQLSGMADRCVHITLIAGSEEEFNARYQRHERWMEKLWGTALPDQRPEVSFIKPATAASFGSINKTILRETGSIARETGILMDPVYSVKHFYTVKCAMETSPPKGPQLLLFNGGALGLCGFQHSLAAGLSD